MHQQSVSIEESLVKSQVPRIAQVEDELTLMFNTFASFRDKQKADSSALTKLESELASLSTHKQHHDEGYS